MKTKRDGKKNFVQQYEKCRGDKQINENLANGCKEYDDTNWGYRHQQAFVLLIFLTIAYSIRTCMGVVLVAMIAKGPEMNSTIHINGTNSGLDAMSNNSIIVANTSIQGFEDAANNFKVDGFWSAMIFTPPHPKVYWSKKEQDVVLSAFFWGYFLMQIPGGHVAHRFGARKVLTASMIINSVMFIFAPWIAYYGGWISMAICRCLQGLGQGVVFPAMHAFFGKWARLEERARLTSYSYAGISLGPVLGLLLAGLTAGSGMGWPGALRLFGVLAAIAAAAIWFWLADSPEDHGRISHAERRFIHEGLGTPDGTKRNPIPWVKILLHPGMFAITVAHIASTWVMNTMYVEMPIYMDKVLEVDVKTIGLLMALPFLVMFVLNFVFGWIGDYLIVSGRLGIAGTRKLLNSFGFVVSALGLIAMEFSPCNVTVIELLLIFVNGTKTSSQCGFFVNHIDISPNYAGVLLSVSNFLSNAIGAQAPLITGWIVHDPTSHEQWRIVFRISASMLLVAAVLYQWLGTAERATWDQQSSVEVNTDKELKPMISVEVPSSTKTDV